MGYTHQQYCAECNVVPVSRSGEICGECRKRRKSSDFPNYIEKNEGLRRHDKSKKKHDREDE